MPAWRPHAEERFEDDPCPRCLQHDLVLRKPPVDTAWYYTCPACRDAVIIFPECILSVFLSGARNTLAILNAYNYGTTMETPHRHLHEFDMRYRRSYEIARLHERELMRSDGVLGQTSLDTYGGGE